MVSKVIALAAVAAAALLAVAKADDPAPARWWGTYSGTMAQSFALANATDPASYECLPSGSTVSRPVTVNITATNITRAGLAATNVNAGPATYYAPATEEKTWNWASVGTNNIVTLRNDAGIVECYYARLSGSGDNRQLTMIALGGAPFEADWTLQCNPQSYEQLPNYLTQPYCSSPQGTRTAYNSTTLLRVNYVGGGEPDSSSATTIASILSAMGAVAAGAVWTLA